MGWFWKKRERYDFLRQDLVALELHVDDLKRRVASLEHNITVLKVGLKEKQKAKDEATQRAEKAELAAKREEEKIKELLLAEHEARLGASTCKCIPSGVCPKCSMKKLGIQL